MSYIVDPKEVSTAALHAYMLSAVAPRPIAFASTVDSHGEPNLSPFSFFNAFGSNPPTLIFSPARRVRDNTVKHTLENVMEVPEVVINTVSYSIVQQMSLSSTEYDKGVSEFLKSGLTPIASRKVKPYRVKESPVSMECKVTDIIETGKEGGAGNLIVCEILLMHIDPEVMTDDKKIDQQKIDLVARLGGNWYCRASGDSLFEVAKPIKTHGVGVDEVPHEFRESHILTGNDLGKLGNVEQVPNKDQLNKFRDSPEGKEFTAKIAGDTNIRQQIAHELLLNNEVAKAWKILLF
ncbi:MAG: flavin reductase family protein [Bacteroidia bacterium]|nr:flavin reductase family protein [Bacteroidia bacterium]